MGENSSYGGLYTVYEVDYCCSAVGVLHTLLVTVIFISPTEVLPCLVRHQVEPKRENMKL